jgi:porphobilinogen synthase
VRKLVHRPRRLRRTAALRNLVRETNLSPHDFILPLFVNDKISARRAIRSMPGVDQLAPDEVVTEAARAEAAGLQAVLLFGIPNEKDEGASGAYAENGVVQEAIRAIKTGCPELLVITDVCLCEYMSHGHCGVTRIDGDHFHVLNDESVALLVKTALSHAAAGADIVAPSDMMDGRIGAIREALDAAGYDQTGVMSYAAKFASSFYGPFREAAESPPQFGDRRSYQMDPANAAEALREVALDVAEGADIILVKPALPYLDILRRVRERFDITTAVYHVSGEYAMVKAAAERGWLEEKAAVLEIMTGLKRAGADFIVTYWAKELAEWTRR